MNDRTKNAEKLDEFRKVDLGMDVIHFRLEKWNAELLEYLQLMFRLVAIRYGGKEPGDVSINDQRQLEIPFPKQ